MRLAVFSDLHYSHDANVRLPRRKGQLGLELARAAIECINGDIRPDAVFVGGDLVDCKDDVVALAELAPLFRRLDAPCLVVPGNHDPAPEVFYRVVERPPEFLDIGGVRLIPFCDDPETAHYNSCRSAGAGLAAMSSSPYPVVMLQHVPLFSPGTAPSRYNYDNAEEILEVASLYAVLSVSGHFHEGYGPAFESKVVSVAAPALCEAPHGVVSLELDGQGRLAAYSVHYIRL